MKKKIITVMGYTILFIEALLLFSITILGVLKFTIFNDSYLKKELVNNNYYEELSDEIKTEMSYYTNQSGFEDEILENILKFQFQKNCCIILYSGPINEKV